MFCQKCGNKMAEGGTFCQKCGEKRVAGQSVQQARVTPVQASAPSPQRAPFTVEQIKSKKKFLIGGAIAVLILIIIIAAVSGGNSRVDYIETVKQMKPLASAGDTSTYGSMLNKYISSAKWKQRKQSRALTYVDVSGSMKDVDGSTFSVMVTFSVVPTDDRNIFIIGPHMLKLYGQDLGNDNAMEFVGDLFDANDEGFNTLADYYRDFGFGIAEYYLNN